VVYKLEGFIEGILKGLQEKGSRSYQATIHTLNLHGRLASTDIEGAPPPKIHLRRDPDTAVHTLFDRASGEALVLLPMLISYPGQDLGTKQKRKSASDVVPYKSCHGSRTRRAKWISSTDEG